MTKPFTYEARQIGGKGWTVVKKIGSKRAGRTYEATDCSQTLTMHQAQATASAMNGSR